MAADPVTSVGPLFAIPASAAQDYICRYASEKPAAWNVAVRFRLRGDLQPAQLETAINRVVAQHEILRTSFLISSLSIQQRIAGACFVPLAYFDVDGSDLDTLSELDRISKAEAHHSFDLEQLPLIRAAVVKLAPQEHVLLLTLHHAISDGWSIGILSAEIMAAYEAVCEGHPFTYDDAALQYADYAVAQSDYRTSPEYKGHADYWQQKLQRLAPISSARSGPSGNSEAEIRSRLLSLALTRQIEELARREGLTFFQSALSAFACARMLHSGRPEVAFATPVSGRYSAETENMLGSFVNYLPVSLTIDPASTHAEFRRLCSDLITGMQAHGEFRMEDMLQTSAQTLAPLFDHLFICQRDFVSAVQGGRVELSAIPSVTPGALHAMTFFLVERSDGWRASCEVDLAVYSAADAEQMLDHFERVLESFIDEPASTIAGALNLETASTPHTHRPSSEILDLPASEAQQRYWMLQQVQTDESSLHLRIRLTIKGEFDADIAHRAFQLLVDRHETLRTSFFTSDDVLKQRIHPPGTPPNFESRDLPNENSGDTTGIVHRLLRQEDQHSFTGDDSSLLRILILRTACSESILAITLPHLLGDGWSCGLLLREFYAAYDSLRDGQQPSFEPLPIQYSDFCAHEQQWSSSAGMQARLQWWKDRLPPRLPALDLPTDVSLSSGQTGIEFFVLDPMLTSAAKQFARDYEATSFSLYGAALLALLSMFTRQSELSLVTPFANRTTETEAVIGPFATPVLIHATAQLQSNFYQFLALFQSNSMAAFENAIALERCFEFTGLQSRLGRHALNQVSFFFQKAFVAETTTAGFTAVPMPAAVTSAAFEWQVAIIDYGSEVRVEFQYDVNLWSAESIRLVLEHYQRLLSDCIFHPEIPLSQIDICSEEEHALEGTPEQLPPISRRALNLPDPEKAQPTQPSVALAPVAPATAIERQMLAIWQEVFRSTSIGIDDNFFDLGGHSLMLARIQAQLKKTTGHRILAADIFAAPTIRTLAARLESTYENPAQSRTFPLRQHGTQPPLFLISQSMVFRRMVQWLHPDQPVFTALMLDEDLKNGVHTTFQEIASYYVSLIRSVRPKGPYRIGGWCVSSSLAYEIAQQLRTGGEVVDLLLLVDGWAPGYWRRIGFSKRLLAKSSYYCARIVRHSRALAKASAEQRTAFIAEKWRIMRAAIARQLGTIFYSAGVDMQVKIEEQTTFIDQVVYAASRSYQALPGNIPALVFRSEEQPQGRFLPSDLGWSALLSRDITAVPLPGDHREIFDDPGAQILAQQIASFLDLPAGTHSEAFPSVPHQLPTPACGNSADTASCPLLI
ncbi:MAG TPA: condensation domain-containing protein [Silvibacterium sp.]|nr:condensation domain-containing protein [Silvibacterium sp.]